MWRFLGETNRYTSPMSSQPEHLPSCLPAHCEPTDSQREFLLNTQDLTHGVRACAIMSLDGSSTSNGTSGALGNTVDQSILHGLRAWADVIFVGAQTIRSENYKGAVLDERTQLRRKRLNQAAVPPIATLSNSLNFDAHSPFIHAAAPPLIFTNPHQTSIEHSTWRRRRHALSELGVTIIDIPNLTPQACVRELKRRGYPRITVEGGPTTLADILHHNLIDTLHLSISPRIQQPTTHPLFPATTSYTHHLQLEATATSDDGLLFLRYQRRTR